jgi:hypothetical protein
LSRAAAWAAVLVLGAGAAMAAPAEHEPAPNGAVSVTRTIPDTVRFDQEIQSGNAISMTVTNYGFFGNNFFNRTASAEYPNSRGFEQMVRGGVWIGAHATDAVGEFDGVTCGTVDAAQGPNSTEASEFTPGGRDILKRSILATSEFYDPLRAVSELDFVSDYNDFLPVTVANSEAHRPLRISVHQESYQWNFAEFQNILFVHMDITNHGELLSNLWVGIYTELAPGCKVCYQNWPPSASDPSGMGGYFSKKWIQVDDSLALERAHYCQGFAAAPNPPESGCRLDIVPTWFGIKFLGTKGLLEDVSLRDTTFAIWKWLPGSTFRDEDHERYAIMTAGTIQPAVGDSVEPHTGDPVEVFAVGPFPLVYRDSTVHADFAFVGGSGGPSAGNPRDIQHNAKFAQFAYDHDYVLPIPPPSPRFAVVARDTAIDYYWDGESENAYDQTSPNPHDFEGYRLYVGEDPDTLRLVAQFDAAGDTASFNTGFDAVQLTDPVTVDGVQAKYKFTVRGLRDGFKYYCAVTAFDLGNSTIQPLESGFSQNRRVAVPGPQPGERPGSGPTVFPNPYRVEARWDQGTNVRDHYLWFANLPKKCTLRIYTLAGDLVYEKSFDGDSYQGEGARGLYDPTKTLGTPTLSGTTFAWDLITRNGQAIASGLYLYSVENVADGKYHVGKFLVIKSDREAK